MSVLVTQQAPDFNASAVLADGTIVDGFQLSSLKGKKIVLFFYPLDFTFVCPSEILAHHHRVKDFAERGVELVLKRCWRLVLTLVLRRCCSGAKAVLARCLSGVKWC